MKNLSKKELKELKGGSLPPGGGDPAYPGDRDILNKNLIEDCHCFYNDNSVVMNLNEVELCRCKCKK